MSFIVRILTILVRIYWHKVPPPKKRQCFQSKTWIVNARWFPPWTAEIAREKKTGGSVVRKIKGHWSYYAPSNDSHTTGPVFLDENNGKGIVRNGLPWKPAFRCHFWESMLGKTYNLQNLKRTAKPSHTRRRRANIKHIDISQEISAAAKDIPKPPAVWTSKKPRNWLLSEFF